MGQIINRREFLKVIGSAIASVPLLALSKNVRDTGTVSRSNLTSRPNIMIVVFDAFSATNMSLYGYPRQTTPNINQFASRSTVYNRHYSGGNFTSPGTASLLTGLYPWTHRAFNLNGTVWSTYADHNLFKSLPENQYTTMAFTHNNNATLLLHQFSASIDVLKNFEDLMLFNENFLAENLFSNDFNSAYIGERAIMRGQRGEDTQLPSSLFFSALHHFWRDQMKQATNAAYKDQFPRKLPSANADPFLYKLEDAIDLLISMVKTNEAPFFGYFHFLPPHEPYRTRHEFVDIFLDGWNPPDKPLNTFSQGFSSSYVNERRREYDEYIAYLDAEFGRLVSILDEMGLMDNTYLFLTSDHGEMFERGILEHITPTLYEPIIRVPLVIHKPGQQDRVDVNSPTNAVDIFPTIQHLTGQPVQSINEGSILPTFSSEPVDPQRSTFTLEAKNNPRNALLKQGTVAMIKGHYKMIHYFGYSNLKAGQAKNFELFNLQNDPDELTNLYDIETKIAKELQNELLTQLKKYQTEG